jgi:hypothetical protein
MSAELMAIAKALTLAFALASSVTEQAVTESAAIEPRKKDYW